MKYLDRSVKTITPVGNMFYLKTPQEIILWEKLKGKSLREISEDTGLNKTRIHRLRTYGGMTMLEYDKFLKSYLSEAV